MPRAFGYQCRGAGRARAAWTVAGAGVPRFLADDTGATAIEYGLIVSLVAIVVITAVTAVGTNLRAKFNTIGNSIGGA